MTLMTVVLCVMFAHDLFRVYKAKQYNIGRVTSVVESHYYYLALLFLLSVIVNALYSVQLLVG